MDVTVIIPVFNQEKFIQSCIESGKSQTVPDVDILIVDDGSTDRTSDLIRQINGIRILTQKNAGTSRAWNLALQHCSTKYVIGLDSDDEFFPETIETMMKAARLFPNADLLYSDYVFIDQLGKHQKPVFNPEPINTVDLLLNLCNNLGQPNNFLPFGHVRLYKRQSLLSVGGFNDDYFFAEDYELMLRMAEKGMTFRHVGQILYKYRWHLSNKGVVYRKQQKGEVRKAVEEYRQRMSQENDSYA